MFARKNKQSEEQGRGRRPVGGERPQGAAFSYYASSRPDVAQPRRSGARQPEVRPTGKSRQPRRLSIQQAPFWLLVIVAVVCGVKLLLLSTNPKVVIVGQGTVADTYQQSTATYATAAHKLLASSITNRTKLTANVTGTSQALQQQFPELQTVSLGLPLIGNRPLLYIQIAPPSLILQTPKGNFALNQAGVVLAKLHTIPPSVPLLNDQASDTPQVGRQFLPGSTISFIRTISYQLTAAKLPPTAFVLPPARPYELDVQLMGKAYTVRYNLAADALQQSGAAVATIGQLAGSDPSSYLDVRVPERAYYK